MIDLRERNKKALKKFIKFYKEKMEIKRILDLDEDLSMEEEFEEKSFSKNNFSLKCAIQ